MRSRIHSARKKPPKIFQNPFVFCVEIAHEKHEHQIIHNSQQ